MCVYKIASIFEITKTSDFSNSPLLAQWGSRPQKWNLQEFLSCSSRRQEHTADGNELILYSNLIRKSEKRCLSMRTSISL